MATTVADQMVETFAAASVQRIYGIVDNGLTGFTLYMLKAVMSGRDDGLVELAHTNLRH
jgi:hypothetical protein